MSSKIDDLIASTARMEQKLDDSIYQANAHREEQRVICSQCFKRIDDLESDRNRVIGAGKMVAWVSGFILAASGAIVKLVSHHKGGTP